MYINRIAIGYPKYYGSQSDRNGLVKLAKIPRTQLTKLAKLAKLAKIARTQLVESAKVSQKIAKDSQR